MEKLFDASYKQDHDNFMEKLKECYEARGKKLGRIPTFGGQPLDLYALYNTVTSFGGISVVTEKKKWDQVFTALGFPPCTNAAFALRQHYARYLEAFEKIYFLGEEADDTTSTSDSFRAYPQPPRYRRMNQLPKITSVGEPMVQNFNRLKFSLQSAYPNEVDFALNICSLLSNVTNSIFNLAKCPQVLSLILGHVGIWCKDDSHVDELCAQWHSQKGEKDYFKFWKKSLTNSVSVEVLKESTLGVLQSVEASEDDFSSIFFAAPPTKKFETNKTPELTRISQIAVVLYNFSFEPLNAMFMCQHDAAKRFILLAGSCKQNFLQRTALDTLDNMADHLIVGRREDPFNQQFLRVLHCFFKSENKLQRVRAQSVLAKLASLEENRDILVDLLSREIYQCLVETLYLPDICLLLYALDSLYYLSGLCEETADNIVKIHGSIKVLISLSTVRAESFGNQAIEGYRIIENKLSIFTPKNQMWLKQQQQKAMANRPPHPGMMQGMHSVQRPYGPPMHRPGMPPSIPRQPGPPIGPYGVPYFNPRGHMQRMPNMPNQVPPGMPPTTMIPPGMPPTSIGMRAMPPTSLGSPGMPPTHLGPSGMPRLPIAPTIRMPTQGIPAMPRQIMPSNSIDHHAMLHTNLHPATNEAVPTAMPSKEASPPMLAMSKNIQDPSQKSAFKKPKPQEQQQKVFLTQPSDEEMIEFESDVFISHWMSGFYEPHSKNQITISFIYHDFTNTCKELQRSEIVSKDVFVNMLRVLLPPDRVHFEDVKEDFILHGIKRRQIPVQVHSKIPKSLYLQLLATGQLKPKLHAPSSISSQPSTDTPVTPVTTQPSTPTETYSNVLGDNKLSNSDECRAMIEKLKKEIQGHFMHFHAQRQYIQTIQTQAQMIQKQSPQPPAENILKEIQIRIQGHYQQMQMHFQKLQQLNTLSEEVQSKLKGFEDQSDPSVINGSINKNASATPSPLNGQVITVPPPVPLLSEHKVNIEHGILSSSINSISSPGNSPRRGKSNRGKSKRGGKKLDSPRKVNGQDPTSQLQYHHNQLPINQLPINGAPFTFNNPFPNATPVSQLPASNHQTVKQPVGLSPNASVPNSIALKNPFGQFPHMEALKTLYKNNIRSSSESSDPISPSIPNGPKNNGRQLPITDEIELTSKNESQPGPIKSSLSPSLDKNEAEERLTLNLLQVNGNHNKIHDDKELSEDNLPNGDCYNSTDCNGDVEHNKTIPETEPIQIYTNGNATREEKERLSDIHNDITFSTNKRKLNGDISPISEKKLKLGLLSSSTDKLNGSKKIIVGREDVIKDDQKQVAESIDKAKVIVNGIETTDFDPTIVNENERSTTKHSDTLQSVKRLPSQDAIDGTREETSEQIKQDEKSPERTVNDHEINEPKTSKGSNLTTPNPTNNLFLKLSEQSSRTPETILSTESSLASERNSCFSTPNTRPELKIEGDRTFLLLHGTQKVDGVFPCQWDRCTKQPFITVDDLLNHMVESHAPVEGKMSRCKVKHCSSSHKPRGALICHFKEKHCQSLTPDDVKKRQDFQIEDESPVTRSIRYTATLILRNLIRNSSSGRDILTAFEQHLALIAISPSEAMTAALDSLYELNTNLVSDDEEEDLQISDVEEETENETIEEWDEPPSSLDVPSSVS